MSGTIEIELNGARRTLPEGTTVAGLVALLELRPEVVAVERNRALVRRADHATTELAPGDRVEVVTLVGGG
jgi:thiamine biosynthesis protein ThiS